MDRKDFDFDFDFEKEYGFDPKTLDGPEYDGELDVDQLDFDLNDPIFAEEPQAQSAPVPVSEEIPVDDFDADAFSVEDFLPGALPAEDYAAGELPAEDCAAADLPVDDFAAEGFAAGNYATADILPEAFPPDGFSAEEFSMDAFTLEDFDTDDPVLDDMTLDLDQPHEQLPQDEDDTEEAFSPAEAMLPLDEELSAEDSPEEAMPPLEIADEPQNEAAEVTDSRPERRRETRKERRQRIRKFKEEKLPMIIAAVAAGFILFFTFGAIIRGLIHKAADDKAQAGANQSSQSAAQKLDEEAQRLLDEAAVLASGYDYEGAIAKLDSFSGELSAYSEMVSKRSAYNQAFSQLVAWTDPSKIPNLSFHVLIADPGRAFTNASLGKKYNQNFVTIDEFSKILQQLYDNGYVLVSMEDVFTENVSQNGAVTYAPGTIYLPADKKPVMITETLVNYLAYMIDSDNDGQADKGGAGFASRLVLENGQIKAELVTSTGETIVGDYDLVPILDSFIKAHPDFSYRGARALLAVCGHEGVFGYRTNKGVINTKGQAYYDEQVAGAKEVVAALKAEGYDIACYTYENIPYGNSDATKIKNDLTKWSEEVKPILGDVDILIFAQNSEIDDYTGSKYNVVYSSGFRYFINSATSPWTEISTNYVRQSRLMVTGTNMAYYSNMFSSYFNAMSVMNSARGTVPN